MSRVKKGETLAERITEDSWIKGSLKDDEGRMCLLGHVAEVLEVNRTYAGFDRHPGFGLLVDIIRDEYPERTRMLVYPSELVWSFNDHDDTILEEVQRVAEKWDAGRAESA